MIKVKTRKINGKKDLTSLAYNAAAEGFAKEVVKTVKNLKCDKHPSSTSTLLIIADKNKTMKIDKRGFCCSDFADSIQINIR